MTPCSARARVKSILEIWQDSEFPHDRKLASALEVLLTQSEPVSNAYGRVIMPCAGMSAAELVEFCLMHGAKVDSELRISAEVPEMRRILHSSQNAVDGTFHKMIKEDVPRKFHGTIMKAFRASMQTRPFTEA